MASPKDYLLPEWAQYTTLFVIVTVVFLYQFATNPSHFLLVVEGGAVLIFGGMAWISVMFGEDPLEHSGLRQIIIGYVIIAAFYLGIAFLYSP